MKLCRKSEVGEVQPMTWWVRSVGILRAAWKRWLPAIAATVARVAFVWVLAIVPVAATEGSGTPPTLPAVRIVQPDPAEPATAPEGHLVVRWEPVQKEGGEPLPVEPGAYRYELRLSSLDDDPDAPLDLQTLFVGDDRASFVSGLPDGAIQIRVRAVAQDGATGPWSPPLRVEVDYPSRRTVTLLMSLGALLLVATVAVVVAGHLRTSPEGGDNP